MSEQELDREIIRAARQEAADRKAARLEGWAASAEKKADALKVANEPYSSWEFITEPIKIGHHSESRHRRLRERISQRMDKEMELRNRAAELRRRAASLRSGVRVAGDAEHRRQLEREANDTLFRVGSKVRDLIFGPAEIVKVNKKSYTLLFESGWKCARDKSFIRGL